MENSINTQEDYPLYLGNPLCTRMGWKVHRLTMMQWSHLTKCGLFFNIVSLVIHTLLPLMLQQLDSCGIEALIMILEKVLNCRWLHHQSNTASQPCIFSCWWTENSQMVPNQNMEGDQPVWSHSHAQQPLQPQTCVQEHCPGETGVLVKQDSICQFSRPSPKKCLYYYFQSPE